VFGEELRDLMPDRVLPIATIAPLDPLALFTKEIHEVARLYTMLTRGRTATSFFAWAVRERMIPTNPVTPTRVPKASTPRTEMYPFSSRRSYETDAWSVPLRPSQSPA
jgi:hypothetical protein